MQTFLPYPSFQQSARFLDKRRMWKQVVETKQILCILRADGLPDDWKETSSYKNQKWINHPAVKMWVGYEECLKLYFNDFLDVAKNVFRIKTQMEPIRRNAIIQMPWWMNDENFHRSHRARLIDKLPSHYEPLWPDDKNYNNGKYWWPDNESKTFKII